MSQRAILNTILRSFHPRNVKKKLLHIVLRGNTVECPCCGSRYITFLPAGIKKRANAKCIQCGSLERHRTLWLYLHEKPGFFTTPAKLLHVAPEIQLYQKLTKIPNISYHSIDLHPDKYWYGHKTKKMDVTAMTYTDESFDIVICNHVLEHIPDDRKAISEIYRVCKTGGFAILNVPVNNKLDSTIEDPYITDPVKMKELFGQPDHVRVYGNDYITRLTGAGFKVEEIDFVSKFSHNEQFRYGLKPQELIYYCSK